MKNIVFRLFTVLFFCCSHTTTENTEMTAVAEEHPAQPSSDSLRMKIQDIIRGKKSNIGVAVLDLKTGDTLSVNGDTTYVMMSVVKFAQALFLMHKVDEGKLSLKQQVSFTKADLVPGTFSLLR